MVLRILFTRVTAWFEKSRTPENPDKMPAAEKYEMLTVALFEGFQTGFLRTGTEAVKPVQKFIPPGTRLRLFRRLRFYERGTERAATACWVVTVTNKKGGLKLPDGKNIRIEQLVPDQRVVVLEVPA